MNIEIVNTMKEGIDSHNYAYARCDCFKRIEYAIKIPKKNNTGLFRFNCPKCGRELGIVITK